MQIVVLNRAEVRASLRMEDVLRAVEHAYCMKAAGETGVWPLVSHEFEELDAVMDIRSGFVAGDVGLHGLKMLNNFPHNAQQGLPVFNGMLMVFDSSNGLPLGIMDASYITSMRTGAAGALGLKALARADVKTLTLLGAGKQAAYQIAAALIARPGICEVYIADPINPENARAFAAAMPQRLAEEFAIATPNVRFMAAQDLATAVRKSDAIITITPSRAPLIRREWVKPGTHFSCIGADMEGKEEIDPWLFHDARIFADDRAQCARVGEMEIPLKKGVITPEDIAGELGEVLCGKIHGRTSEEQITIFDATGLALLDLVTARLAIDGAAQRGIGLFTQM